MCRKIDEYLVEFEFAYLLAKKMDMRLGTRNVRCINRAGSLDLVTSEVEGD